MNGTSVVVGPSTPVNVSVGKVPNVVVDLGGTSTIEVDVGTRGKPGAPGPEGGTPVVALPYDEWPPVDPQPNTLYLRLAP
jgi:hypothetical protein